MKLSKSTIITAFIISIALFFIGMYIWGDVLIALLPIVGDSKYIDTSMKGQFNDTFLFGGIVALIPLFAIFVWRFAPIITPPRRIVVVMVIIAAMVVAVLLRREIIKKALKEKASMSVLDYTEPTRPVARPAQPTFPFNEVYFEYFLLGGLIVGALLSLVILREKEIARQRPLPHSRASHSPEER
jgi:hypothetical protein